MALNLLIGFVYELVQQSWLVSTVLVKYILFFTAINTYIEEGIDLESYRNVLLENSRELISIIVLLGFLNILIGLRFAPYFKTFSQLVTVLFFGYLFWKY